MEDRILDPFSIPRLRPYRLVGEVGSMALSEEDWDRIATAAENWLERLPNPDGISLWEGAVSWTARELVEGLRQGPDENLPRRMVTIMVETDGASSVEDVIASFNKAGT